MKEYDIQPRQGLIHRGNWHMLKQCMRKARAGEKVTVGFLGGSITQGSLADSPETCYAYLVYEWWKKKFPGTEIVYVNGGIGGTTSQFGVSRVKEHMLCRRPDFLLIEFAVNDDNTAFYEETYEGLVRAVLGQDEAPAVLLMNNVRYDNGESAEEMHLKVAEAYALPMVSMKSVLWPKVSSGEIVREEITPDGLHPNDAGHRLVASVVTACLEQIYEEMDREEAPAFAADSLPAPITANAYEHSVRYQNHNAAPVPAGFQADRAPSENIRDVFTGGYTASRAGDKITFRVTGTGVAVQYRKSVKKPAPVAKAVIDGDEAAAVVLDANFDEDWGDCLYIETVLYHGEMKEHLVEITVTEAHEDDAAPFYLVSVIGSC